MYTTFKEVSRWIINRRLGLICVNNCFRLGTCDGQSVTVIQAGWKPLYCSKCLIEQLKIACMLLFNQIGKKIWPNEIFIDKSCPNVL